MSLRAMLYANYPLEKETGSDLIGNVRGGEPASAEAIALSFIPGHVHRLYRLKVLSRRAISMARSGQWRRLVGALRRRIPLLGYVR